jgi:uncharacterized protein (DUF1786 family)
LRLLCVDIGAFTQDILLFDSRLPVENCPQLVLPSPTSLVAERIEEATRKGRPLLLTGTTMGGGPCTRALRQHLGAGLKAYATPPAAMTFDDDLEVVKSLGVELVSEDEALRVKGALKIELGDLDLDSLRRGLAALGIDPQIEGLAVAVLDHGAAPSGTSDRHFRFKHLGQRVREKRALPDLAYLAQELPPYLTRMRAIAQRAEGLPLLLMDTGPAAALGAGEDWEVARHPYRLCLNLGNAHTVALLLYQESILGLWEHHTHLLTPAKLARLVQELISGRLTHEKVWEEGGHGALVLGTRWGRPFIAATGPRRGGLHSSPLRPYLAAPHGSMMLAGCYGLLRACAHKVDAFRPEIEEALAG